VALVLIAEAARCLRDRRFASTLAATASTHSLAGKHPTPAVIAHAAVHGYVTGFWWAGGFFAAGALITGLLLHGRAPAPTPQTEDQAKLQPADAY
jgi:hypothetical protein